jgi:cell wall assembly regulator SMI1
MSDMKRKNFFIVVGFGLLFVVVVLSIGLFGFTKFKQVMYPPAPPMPPIVSQTAEEILAELEFQLKEKAPQILTNLQPGLPNEKIHELEQQAGISLPDEIKALYRWHNGFKHEKINPDGFRVAGPMPGDYFLPLEDALNLPTLLSNQVSNATATQRAAFNFFAGYTKSWITLFDDGAGDGYFFDPKRKPTDGAVFYHFMEDGGYVFFPSAKNLYAGMVKCYQQGVFIWKEENDGASLHEDFDAAAKIWSEFGVNSAP